MRRIRDPLPRPRTGLSNVMNARGDTGKWGECVGMSVASRHLDYILWLMKKSKVC